MTGMIDNMTDMNNYSKILYENFKKIIFPSLGVLNLKKCDNHFKIPYEKWINKQ